jgi:hypothetical protein
MIGDFPGDMLGLQRGKYRIQQGTAKVAEESRQMSMLKVGTDSGVL